MATKTGRSSGTRPKTAQSSSKTQSTAKAQGTSKAQGTARTQSTPKAQGTPKAHGRTRADAPEPEGGQQGKDLGNVTVTIPRPVITAATAPFAIAGRVLPAKKGLPVYVGLGALAAGGAIAWPVAAGIGVAYASMRRWGRPSAPPDDASGSKGAP